MSAFEGAVGGLFFGQEADGHALQKLLASRTRTGPQRDWLKKSQHKPKPTCW